MPNPYQRRMPADWWLKNRAYFWFMMRELTAVLVAAYCVILLDMLWRLKQGNEPFHDFFLKIQTLQSIAFHGVAFVAALYHAVTWFNLVPKVFVIRTGEEKVPPSLLILMHWALCLVVTVGLVYVVFGLGPKL